MIREVEETVSSREGEPDMDVELASDNKQFQGSDISAQKCYDDSEGLRDQVRISVWWARQVLPIPRMNQNYTQIC